MKIAKLLPALALLSVGAFVSCQKEQEVVREDEVSAEVLTQIRSLGFSTQGVQKTDEGYLVEGDIVLTPAALASTPETQFLRVGSEEQYRTSNLVTGLPREITVRVASTLPSAYVTATNEAIRRFNDENLRITFRRVTSGGAIVLSKAPSGSTYLASAGFPSSGNPYNSVKVNSSYLGSNPGTNYLATILAHEIGHCIGFRHTDYADRSYSCGGSFYNEGASTVGAILIDGTPAGPDPNSWMLACIGTGVNRPFNSNDRTALNFLY